MKCICGYSYETPENFPGRFIKISGYDCVSGHPVQFSLDIPGQRLSFNTDYVYACPKCGTIRLEVPKE